MILDWIRHNRRSVATINVALTLTIAAAAAAGTIAQAWVAASQRAALPQVQSSSVRDLRLQLEERRRALRQEIQDLDALLIDLGKAESALTGALVVASPIRLDPWWLTAVKTLAVGVVLGLSIYAAIVAAAIDLVLLVFGY